MDGAGEDDENVRAVAASLARRRYTAARARQEARDDPLLAPLWLAAAAELDALEAAAEARRGFRVVPGGRRLPRAGGGDRPPLGLAGDP
jgi:hypothetical protein